MLTFYFSGVMGKMTEREILTAGMVGKEVRLEFSEEWDGLFKTVVFSNGMISRDVACTGETVVIPAEILEKPLKRVTVGVYGVSPGGKVVIPTIRVDGPVTRPGVDPSGDPAMDPELPIWAQIQGLIGDMGALETEEKSSLVEAVNELAQTVAEGGAGFGLDKTLSQEGMAAEAKAVGHALAEVAAYIANNKDVFMVATNGVTASHSSAEIAEAAGNGKLVALTSGSAVLLLNSLGDEAVFRGTVIDENALSVMTIKVDGNKQVATSLEHFKNPAALPNPYALTIGDVHYTGSSEVDATEAVRAVVAEVLPDEFGGVVFVEYDSATKTADYSVAEIVQMVASGKTVMLRNGEDVYQLTRCSEGIAEFTYTSIEGSNKVVCCLRITRTTITEEVSVTPSVMQTLKFTGAVSAEYTGASAVTVEVPEAVTDEHIHALIDERMASVKSFGAAGDSVTDDTAAFQAALAASRIVYVPGGTYRLSGGITVGANCELRLSRDTVLDFTQTQGSCITLDMSAGIRGNHATVRVPYAFGGNVVCVSSAESGGQSAVPPFTRWDPMWKTGRYLTDLNIVKPDDRGFHYSVDGTCTGTAVYISADGSAASSYIWGLNFSGLRIAGGFSYGIRAVNVNEGWAHEMRLDAFIDACEIGVSLEDCSCAYVSAIVQPRRAYTTGEEYLPYAKHGIQLIRSTNTDLSGSRVWDWNAANTLWTAGGQYQHIALVGQCRGTILNDFLYYEQSSADIRDLIYTDTASNLEQINILQEPFTRWFKPRDGVPYFSDGDAEKQICLYEDLEGHFQTDKVAGFTDVLKTAIDKDGTVFNGTGYVKNGRVWDTAGNLIDNDYHGCTGLIPCKQGDTVYADGLTFENGDDNDRVLFFDASFNLIAIVNRAILIGGGSYYSGYTELENGFAVTPKAGLDNMAYLAFNIRTIDIAQNPMISVNEMIGYSYEGFLADGVKVKAENVVGLGTLIDEKLGVIENGTY